MRNIVDVCVPVAEDGDDHKGVCKWRKDAEGKIKYCLSVIEGMTYLVYTV